MQHTSRRIAVLALAIVPGIHPAIKPQADDGAQGKTPGPPDAPAPFRPELPPGAAEGAKDLERRIEDLTWRGLEREDRAAQDEALSEATRLAEEVVAIREKHQGPSVLPEPQKRAPEWCELADARWKLRTLRAVIAMSRDDRTALVKAENQEAEGMDLFEAAHYDQGELELRAALEAYRRLFRGDHPDVAKSVNNLAGLLQARGDLQGAEQLYREARDMCRRLFPGDHPNVATSLDNLAMLLEARGDLQGAESLCRESLDMRRRLFPGDHADIAMSLSNLAELLRAEGDIQGAKPLCREALDMRRHLFPGDHPAVATSLNNLAALLQARGDLQAAEPLCREALDMYRRLFPGDHPDVATNLSNLAALLHARGDFQGAATLYRESLDMRRRLFPGNHPNVATSLNNLGGLLQDRGDLQGAEPLYRESLDMYRRLFPDDHPDVAMSLNNLGGLLQDRGDLQAAEPLCREALEMRRRLFPGDHPDVAASLNSLAMLLQARGDLQGAEPLSYEARDMCRRLFPGDHPDVATSLNNLAMLLQARGDLPGADPLFREALDMYRRLFPGDHPAVATSLNSLAVFLRTRGDLQGAEQLYREALDMCRRFFPGDHPYVATTLDNLGVLLEVRGNLQGAESIYRESLDMRRRLFPGDHPDNALSLNNLAALLQARGDLQGAEVLCRESLDMYRRLFPDDHPEVARSTDKLAALLQDRGDFQAAEPLFREALDMSRRLFSGDHPDVATGLNNLAPLIEARGDLTGAEALFREALDMSRRLFSGDHPSVAGSLNNLARLLQARGDLMGAESLCREALDMRRRLFPGDHAEVAMSLDNLGMLLRVRGDLQSAEPLHREALDMADRLRPRIVGDERARAAFADQLRIPGKAVHYGATLILANRTAEVLLTFERGRGRAFLDLLDRGSLDLATLGRTRAGERPEALSRLELVIGREEKMRIDVTTAEALAEGIQKERKATETLDGLEPEERTRRLTQLATRIDSEIEKVKDLRRKLSDAGSAVLVELHGLVPDARPLSRDEVLVTLPAGDLVLSYLSSGWTLILATAFEGKTSGFLVGQESSEAEHIIGLAQSVRTWIANRPSGPDNRSGHAAARELLGVLLPEEARALARKARRLVVLPDSPINDIPFDLLLVLSGDPELEGKAVVHAASATVYLNRVRAPVPARAGGPSALLVADPLYEREPRPEPEYPEAGALVDQTFPETSAAKAKLARGDVILEYDGRKLGPEFALADAIRAAEAAVANGKGSEDGVLLRYWRGGDVQEARVPPGRLGVQIVRGDPRPHLAAWARAARGHESQKAEVSATDQVRLFGGGLAPLPGTRREALVIAEAFAKAKADAKILLGEDATVPGLSAAAEGKRFLHLATHGLMGSSERPYDASLAFTRPRDPSAEDIGFLRLDDIIRGWRGKLETCDLVVLSACNTERGVRVGESMLALPWGFFYAGARTVIASLWEVDDDATALLMGRLYENLLGTFGDTRRVGGREYAPGTGLGPEPALREARGWLRELTHEEAAVARKKLEGLVEAGKGSARGPGSEVDAPRSATERGARPYAHPYYWAAFICVGKGE